MKNHQPQQVVRGGETLYPVEWLGAGFILIALWLFVGKESKIRPVVPLSEQSVLEKFPHGPRVSALVSRDAREMPRLVTRNDESVRTLYDAFRLGLRLSSDGPCLGYKEFGIYKWITYSEVLSLAKDFGSGLMTIGLEPNQRTRIGMYSVNRPEWVIVEQAAYMFSMSIVPLCDSFSTKKVADIIEDANITLVVCDHDLRCEALLDNVPIPLKTVVMMKQPVWSSEEKADYNHIFLLSFEEVIQLGAAGSFYERPPGPDDVCTVCYTSGTTGEPKGIVLTHKNLIASLAGATLHLGDYKPCRTDVMMSFLPPSQIQERCAEYCVFMNGGAVGFYGGDITKLKNDMKLLRPTVVTAVPRILNTLYNKAMDSAKSNWIKKMLLVAGLSAKYEELKRGVIRKNSCWDYLVFGRFQKELGDRVRLVVVGSASVRAEVLTFMRCALGCPVIEGYGQCECGAGITMTVIGDHVPGHVGPPLPSCSVKLADVPEMDCYAEKGRGEICVKGPSVFSTFLHEKGSSTIDSDGWHHTGDIGQWLPNGTLKIIDRKEDTFKLSHGHFISPLRLEDTYMQSPCVHQICVYGDSLKSNLVAIVVPDERFLKSWAMDLDLDPHDKEFCKHPLLKMKIMDSLETCGRVAGVKPVEHLKNIFIQREPFTVENGLLTPTMKTRRFKVIGRFKQQIKDMYDQYRI